MGLGAGCDATLLPGSWTSANYSIQIAPDLTYVAAGGPNLTTIQAQGNIAVGGCTLSFTDTGGNGACPASQVGTHTFAVSTTALHLIAASDACDGRRTPVSGVTLTRR
jgi:hypothetical protein